jgi:hypothetical protein
VIIWNITLQSADIVYIDALEFYASVREAAKRRVDAAETMFKDLEQFTNGQQKSPPIYIRLAIDEKYSSRENGLLS